MKRFNAKQCVRTLAISAASLAVTWSSLSFASDLPATEVYSDAVVIDPTSTTSIDSLVSPEVAAKLTKAPTQLPSSPDAGSQIAEPGTLGLMALAGLMGGAVAMRHRLG